MDRAGESSDGVEFSNIQNSPLEAERLDILEGHGIAHRKTVTTLGAPTRENRTAILGRHTITEAMLVDSFTIAGLKSSFHENSDL